MPSSISGLSMIPVTMETILSKRSEGVMESDAHIRRTNSCTIEFISQSAVRLTSCTRYFAVAGRLLYRFR